MNQTRPTNLNLFTIYFPIPAVVSFLHRATGLFLFLLVPLVVWGLQYSLTPEGFLQFKSWLSAFSVKLILWVLFVPFCYHLVAGVRHLLSDVHVGDSLQAGRITAWLTFVVTGILMILVGVWLW